MKDYYAEINISKELSLHGIKFDWKPKILLDLCKKKVNVKKILKKLNLNKNVLDENGNNALNLAVMENSIELVDILIKNLKVNPKIKNLKKQSSLDISVENNFEELVVHLIENHNFKVCKEENVDNIKKILSKKGKKELLKEFFEFQQKYISNHY